MHAQGDEGLSTNALTQSNYRERIALWQREVRASELLPGIEAAQANYCELIGNVCWHFAPGEAAEWFRRAVDLRRRGGWKPDWRSALTLSKLGDALAFQEECQRAVERLEKELSELRKLADPVDIFEDRERERSLLGALDGLSLVAFLQGRYEDAMDIAEAGVRESDQWASRDPIWPGGPTPTHRFVQTMSLAVLGDDPDELDEALEQLRGALPTWPSDAGRQFEEFYRYARSIRDARRRSPG